MSDSPADALEQAIALYRAPTRLSRMQARPLGNTLLLLRIAASDRAAIANAARTTGETAQTVIDAALLYIQQVLFADTADAYRLLGARPGDATAQIQEHYRWLMRWLHPDRQPERWEVVYSDRVNQAWQILRSPERRAAYDLSLDSTTTVDVRERQLPMRHRAARRSVRPLLSARAKRRLPRLILGGLALGALIVLGLLYDSQEETSVPAQAATDAPAPGLPVQMVTDERVAHVAGPPMNAQPHDSLSASGTAAIGAVVRGEKRNGPVAVAIDGHAGIPVATVPEAVVPQPTKPATQPTIRPAQEVANALSGSFTRAYAAGDLMAMMGLFSADAVNDRGGVDAIATDYDNLFRETRSRELRLERLAWTTSQDRIIGSGPFEANILRRGESMARRIDGWITIEARLVDGHWRIQRIINRNAP